MRKITRIIAASAAAIMAGAATMTVTASAADAIGAAEDVITVVSPANGKTFAIDNEKIDDFYKNYKLNYSNDFYGCGEFLTTPVTLEWECGNGQYYQVYLASEKHFTNAEKYLTTETSLTINNIIPNREYYWKVKVTDDKGNQNFSKVYTFTPTAYVRTISVDGVDNMRDLGGAVTSDGKQISYGVIYRSANFNGITEKGKTQIRRLGIKTDLDLRGEDSLVSPLGADVKRINYNAPYYADQYDDDGNNIVGINGREDYVQAFVGEIKTCANPDNYPIGFHCAIGRDRTGTLAAMLYAVCGVSREDIIRDYELSWFCESASNNPYIQVSAITRLCDFIERQQGDTFKDKASNYLLSIGVTQAELDSVRNILIGRTEIPDDSAVSAAARQTAGGEIKKAAAKTAVSEVTADYDISDIVSKVGPRSEYKMTVKEKVVGEKPLKIGESVKFAYKERSEKNADGHYSRTAFGIGSYGFYFYHSAGDIGVRVCNMQSSASNWGRGGTNVATIPDKTFKTYGEIVLKTQLKEGDANTVILTLTYPGGSVSHEFSKDDASDMLFRFGDHDIPDNYVKSLAPKWDTEPPVISVAAKAFKTTDGTYPVEDYTVSDNYEGFTVSVSWSDGALDRKGRLTAGTHTCTITAVDVCENVATETLTYTVEKEPQQTLYKITFVSGVDDDITVIYADGEVKENLIPTVPAKKYYAGAWESFELEKNQNQKVNAVYTPVEYTVTFKADGKIVGTKTYTVENTEITEPAVPEKSGYIGKWKEYELKGGDKTVIAIYEKTGGGEPTEPVEPVEPTEPTDPVGPGTEQSSSGGQSGKKGGCGGTVGGDGVLLAVSGAIAVALRKKRMR